MSLLLALPPSVSAFNLVGLRVAQPMRPALHAAMSAKDLGGGIDKETHDLWRPGEAVDPARNLLQLLDLWDEEQDGAADECSISDAGENAGCCMLGPEVRRLHLESVQNQMRCSRPPLSQLLISCKRLNLMRFSRACALRSHSRPCATAWTWPQRRRSLQRSSRWS